MACKWRLEASWEGQVAPKSIQKRAKSVPSEALRHCRTALEHFCEALKHFCEALGPNGEALARHLSTLHFRRSKTLGGLQKFKSIFIVIDKMYFTCENLKLNI